MKIAYEELFKTLTKSYYNGTFDKQINELTSDNTVNLKELIPVISTLCGVNINYSDHFIDDLKNAISNYTPQHKIVEKIKECSRDCIDDAGETLCQKSCPFNAILIDARKNTTYIDTKKCTDCGVCVNACPNNNLLDKVEFLPIINLLKSNTPVIASVAPAITGQFGENVTIDQLRTAFKKIGFTDMIEVAFFADMLTLREAIEFDTFVKTKDDFMITSCCCPMWVGMLKKVYNDLIKHVSPSVSPMIASGRILKKLNPECKVVFVCPCIAKKAEAKEKDLLGDIDYVLTFDELKNIFEALDIYPETLPEDTSTEYASKGGRLYARSGGVSIAVKDAVEKIFPNKTTALTTIKANGIKECKSTLDKLKNGKIDATFIEGMGCIGGCVGGPKALIPQEVGTKRVNSFAEQSEIKVAVDSSCMHSILKKLNIYSIEDFKDEEKVKIFERHFT